MSRCALQGADGGPRLHQLCDSTLLTLFQSIPLLFQSFSAQTRPLCTGKKGEAVRSEVPTDAVSVLRFWMLRGQAEFSNHTHTRTCNRHIGNVEQSLL